MRNCSLLILCFVMLTPIALFADNSRGIGVQTINVSSVSPLLTLKFWDYEAEDGDWVRIVVDGETYHEFELKNAPKTVSIPILFSDKDEVLVNVIGTKSGNGPVTYAVQATGLGSSVEVYKNYADVGSGNSYRIVKTKDDIFSVGVRFLARLFGIGEEGKSEEGPEYEMNPREIAARRFNDLLSLFPNASSVPRITPDMIKIDPESGPEMAWKPLSVAGGGKFIIRNEKDIYDDSDKLVRYNFAHELAHYYHDHMFSDDDDYRSLDLNDKTTAEGFAVLMGIKISGVNAVQETCGPTAYGREVLGYVQRVAHRNSDNYNWSQIEKLLKNELEKSFWEELVCPWLNGRKVYSVIDESLSTTDIIEGLRR